MPSGLPLGLRRSIIITTPTARLRAGEQTRVDYARRGDPEPTGQNLDALALREADRLHIRRNRGHWVEGFRNGFTRGFEGSTIKLRYRGKAGTITQNVLARRQKSEPDWRNTRDACATRRKTHRASGEDLCNSAADPAALQFGSSEQDRKRFHARKSTTINQLPQRVRWRGLAPKGGHYRANVAIADRIDLHHERLLAEVIAPFDHLPANLR